MRIFLWACAVSKAHYGMLRAKNKFARRRIVYMLLRDKGV